IGIAWTYANSDIHLGHIAAYMAGDVLARFHRAKGNNVLMVSGTDCHGTPTTERAIRENKTPREIVQRYHEQYVQVFEKMGMSYDCYTMTATDYHCQKVQDMILKLRENGYIYEKTEPASFCPKCNKFVYDREVEVVCPKCGAVSKGDQCGSCDYVFQAQDLLKAKCRICGSETQIKDNTNLYFALSKFEEPLKQHLENCKQYWRKNTTNETTKFLEEGLLDRAVTRDLNWGVPVPLPNYDDKRIYVWIEAVWGYVTATMLYCEQNGLDWTDFWFKKENQENLIYMCHGKDNIVFHSIIFPALLMATNQPYLMPERCVSSEFLNINGEKISKSKGNGWPMLDMLEKCNPDSLRYFCIANGPEKRDSNFTFPDYHALHNGEIVNKFGNFINRTLNYKGLDGYLPNGQMDLEIQSKITATYQKTEDCIMKNNFKEALETVMALVDDANKYYDEKQPWILFKENKEKFNDVIYTCVQIIANLSNLIEPFMPFSAKKIRDYLQISSLNWDFVQIDCDKNFGKFEALFTRLTDKDVL
ncbi:MAG: methionine--tRNA ligase, partial [Clostridia bacterium]|nr:methionine--tRNA ligase [Clostridia bacterium]